MKTIKKLILLGIIALVSVSCNKSEEPEPNNTSSGSSKVTGTMKATLDGKAWEAKTVSFGGLSALKTVFGKVDDGNDISLQFIDTNLEVNKVYQFVLKDATPHLNGNLVIRVNNQILFAESGTFKITKYVKDKEIQGEMNAECTDFINKKLSIQNCTFIMKN